MFLFRQRQSPVTCHSARRFPPGAKPGTSSQFPPHDPTPNKRSRVAETCVRVPAVSLLLLPPVRPPGRGFSTLSPLSVHFSALVMFPGIRRSSILCHHFRLMDAPYTVLLSCEIFIILPIFTRLLVALSNTKSYTHFRLAILGNARVHGSGNGRQLAKLRAEVL